MAVLVLTAILGVWGYQSVLSSTYATGVGQQDSLSLADGSTIELNSCSKIRVRYSAHERRVELLEGQALFHVAKDPARPFIVRSGHAQVRAVGTQFDVYRKTAGTVVTVVEGQVAVSDPIVALAHAGQAPASPRHTIMIVELPGSDQASWAAGPMLLAAGEQAMVTDHTMQKNAHANVAGATAWTQHQLVFDRTSVAEVAREFNRYNPRPLIVDEAGLADFRISGIFSSTDPASLVRFLREQPGVLVTESSREIHISHE